jgi:uncharacterized protein (TIGR02145 family)
MFKKIIFSLLIFSFLFSGFGFVFASRDVLYEEVKELDGILRELMELLGMEAPPPMTPLTSSVGIPADFLFTKNFARGAKGEHIRYLQIVLNKDTATTVNQSGPGSPGNETIYFGPATFNAARRFQQKYSDEVLKPLGLTIPTGFIGVKTREKLNAILKGEFTIVPSDPPTVPDLPTSTPTPSPEKESSSEEKTPTPAPEKESSSEEKTSTPTPLPAVPSPCKGQTKFLDIRNSETYNLVEIGSQCWMSRNMNYSTEGSWCYGNSNANCEKYGRLYNFQTAKTVCPSGFALPTDDNFKILEREIGMTQEDANKTGWRGTEEGNKVKNKTGWDGNNDSGFTALPAGGREDNGSYSGIARGASFWTSTETGTSVWSRQLYSGFPGVNRNTLPKEGAISVRCIKVY